ncbi:acylneuraminate cytidylyltransferase family protein [Flavobacterium ovatum]|uniref:acylneuraminate cytidylyltransferase family protein n=1 Tax=Flavobacterium ovatum TaxID=1928857 RepID=UPI0034506F9D
MKTIAIIPARGDSKRLPHKNILDLGGIPLIAHSILYAKANSDILDAIYVSTNDEEIKKIAIEYGAKVIDRPEYISGDFEPTITAIQHVLENVDATVEHVVLLQPTNPLRPIHLLKDCWNTYKKVDKEGLFTVTRNHNKLGRIIKNGFQPFNYEIGQRSQDLEPLYFENGLLYISTVKLIKQGKIISDTSFPFEVNSIFANVDIDTQEDLDYAEYLFQKHTPNPSQEGGVE